MHRAQESCVGLDIGTSRIVLARRSQQDYEFHSQVNAFVRIPFSKMTASVFQKEKVPHSVEDGHILVFGNEAEKFANLFHTETRRPMLHGALNPSEPDGPMVLRHIVNHLTASAPGFQKLCFSVPAAGTNGTDNLKYHESVVRQTLADSGCQATCISEGLAVVYGELEESNYTGIGVSCGGGTCNVCLAYLSVPVVCFSIPEAGDFIDARAAAATGEVASRVRMIKEQGCKLNGNADGDAVQRALTVYYDEMIRSLVEAMVRVFSDSRRLPKLDRPVPLVISGGSALPQGFRERFETALKASHFPIPLSDIRLASDPLHSTAKGALVSVLAEQ